MPADLMYLLLETALCVGLQVEHDALGGGDEEGQGQQQPLHGDRSGSARQGGGGGGCRQA